MTTYPEPNCSQISITPPGSAQVFWPAMTGHVTGLKYSSLYPGGCDKMSCTLEAPASLRHRMLTVDATVRVFRGGHKIWEGTLDEPSPGPDGWQITAAGVANAGADFLAVYSTAWPGSEPDEVVDNAISRGLPWVNPGIGQPSGIWLGQAPDSGSQSVADVLNSACSRGGLGWFVNSQPGGRIGNDLTVAALPVTATRLLVCTTPVTRTLGGDVRAIRVRYQVTDDDVANSASATYAETAVTNTGHAGREHYLDLSNAGVMSAASAQAVATQVLKIYQRASFAGPFDVAPGHLLTMGGVPVDPGCEQAGFVCRLVMTDYSYGGEASPAGPVQFIAGGYEWDDHERVGRVTPYQTDDTSLSSLLSAQREPTPMRS